MTWCMSRDRAGDERKDEYSRLEAVIEKHQGLIPRVMETQVKSEVSNLFATNIPTFCCWFNWTNISCLHDPGTQSDSAALEAVSYILSSIFRILDD